MLFCATMRVVAIGQVKYIRKTGIEIMLILWCSLAGLMLYLELVYHFSGFGWSGFWPVYLIMLITAWAGVETIIIGVLRKWLKKFVLHPLPNLCLSDSEFSFLSPAQILQIKIEYSK